MERILIDAADDDDWENIETQLDESLKAGGRV